MVMTPEQAAGQHSIVAGASGRPTSPIRRNKRGEIITTKDYDDGYALGYHYGREAAWTEKWAQEPSVQFFTGKEMYEVMSAEFDAIVSSFMGFQYVLDHTELVVKLLKKLQSGVHGQIIFDKVNFFNLSLIHI